MQADPWLGASALVVAWVAAWSEVQRRSIPGLWTHAALAWGMALHFGTLGWDGLYSSMGGAAVASALLLPAYLGRIVSNGDVRLMAAVGACLGLPLTVMALLFALLAGGALALGLAASRGAAGNALAGAAQAGVRLFSSAAGIPALGSGMGEQPLPYALAIAVGTFAALWVMP
jgi:prepilin peptidase CpaA